ncbi:wax ester/triacylglycerol synthase domain-containing protein [Subtercola lobariae]|uniref:diacylglycerol O-acyltransferase n=1 Tax=Subtercola lobariae TaxID=1588641 RepID=A0A917B2W1_9MICO|nr:wax ester/triacylglycerol synthase domain-containing protein [Subtercola lobariae]GGF17637.1 putative diacyglycerol O-acyltransferase [Subtercola lobariae]
MNAEADRLSPDDARILALESAVLTGHTLKLMIVAPGTPVDLDALRTSVLARVARQPRALQRVEPATADTPARWATAEHFDIAQHVRRRAGTDCATEKDLRRTVSTLMSEHLDRDRPLWTLDLIGPLADGREAIAARMHHAMVDGIAGMRFLDEILLDPHEIPVHAVGVSASIRPPDHQPWWRLPEAVARELGRIGPRSPFDKPITVAREVAFTSAPLAELKAIGASRPTHATVNDVLLAVVAGGLHGWLAGRDALADVRAQIPVSLHHREEQSTELGNHDSFINVDLPLAEPDPLRRLDLISSQTRTEKKQGDAALLYELFHALGSDRAVGEFARRIAGSSREFSVAISNVPGPRVAVSVAGRRVEQLYTSAEPGTHHALRISAISNEAHVGIGFCTDPTALPGIDGLAEGVGRAYAELRGAALGPGIAPSLQ